MTQKNTRGKAESAKEIGDVMAAMLRKLRGMTIITDQDRDLGDEIARRWDIASRDLKAETATPKPG